MKISVVIPAYNEEQFLGACLSSLRAQTTPPDEIIVVDNNSTDNTAAIATRHGVRIIREPRQGIWPATAAGYNSAQYDVIARCDADSVLPVDWIERIQRDLSDDTFSAVTGPGRFYDCSRVLAHVLNIFYMKAYFITVGCALGQRPLFGSNMAFRRSAWQSARQTVHLLYDVHDDIDLSYHLPGRFYYDPALHVGVSARFLSSSLGMVHRYVRGFRSIFIHWPKQAPWVRFFQKR